MSTIQTNTSNYDQSSAAGPSTSLVQNSTADRALLAWPGMEQPASFIGSILDLSSGTTSGQPALVGHNVSNPFNTDQETFLGQAHRFSVVNTGITKNPMKFK